MTKESLKTANEINSKIEELTRHLSSMDTSDKKYVNSVTPMTLNLYRSGFADSVHLKHAFVNMDEFLLIYRSRVEAEIKKLENELLELK